MKQPDPTSVLLVATQQIGDVLLNTPLLRSMRLAWPQARIDVLVYANTGGVLQGNPDCSQVIEIAKHPDKSAYRQLVKRIFRQYDLCVTTQGGDRPYLYALLAAPRRVGLIGEGGLKSAWKRAITQHCVLLDNLHTHTVAQNLVLAERLGITPDFQVVPPHDPAAGEKLDALLPFPWREAPYVVLHPYPMWRYKRWTDAGWQALLLHLAQRGFKVVLTGGPDEKEQAYSAALATAHAENTVSLAGKTSFGVLARLLQSAQAYVGPDTASTHLAAACGTRTVTFYGPSNPVKWGPWPKGCTSMPSPWRMIGQPWQLSGNVLLLQGEGDCVPCREEGCDRHKNSDSRCLVELPASRIIAALEYMLSRPCAS